MGRAVCKPDDVRGRIRDVSDKIATDLERLDALAVQAEKYRTMRALVQGSDSETKGPVRVTLCIERDHRDDYRQKEYGPKARRVECLALTREETVVIDGILARQEAAVQDEIGAIDRKWEGVVPGMQ